MTQHHTTLVYKTRCSRALRRFTVVGLGLLTTLGIVLATAPAALADTSEGGNWDAPPTCFRDGAEVHKHVNADGSELQGVYTYAYEYEDRRYYGNGYESRYIWVYEVQNPMGGMWEMVTAGFAHKHCGTTWTQTSSNFA